MPAWRRSRCSTRSNASSGDHGARRAPAHEGTLDDPAIERRLGSSTAKMVREEVALLDAAAPAYDQDAFLRGDVSPTFFGSALTNVGVDVFLDRFLGLAPPPGAADADGRPIDPAAGPFSAVVFKVQANMDPKHRDRVAFLRVRSGRLEPGMLVINVRTGAPVRLHSPRQFLAQERSAVGDAWAGDVVGVHDRGELQVGDTVSVGGTITYAAIPRFAPEHLATVTGPDPLRRKHLDMGLRQLAEEGLIQVLRDEPRAVEGPRPVVAAVGPLQFDILVHRLEHEYGAVARLETLGYMAARWAIGPTDAVRQLARVGGRTLLYDRHGRAVLLFESMWSLRTALEAAGEVRLLEVEP